jgi:hypothetical protein
LFDLCLRLLQLQDLQSIAVAQVVQLLHVCLSVCAQVQHELLQVFVSASQFDDFLSLFRERVFVWPLSSE